MGCQRLCSTLTERERSDRFSATPRLVSSRLVAFVSRSRRGRGKSLVSSAVIGSLIAATTMTTRVQVSREVDANAYPAGRKGSDEEVATVRLERDAFRGEWNDTIFPPPSLLTS